MKQSASSDLLFASGDGTRVAILSPGQKPLTFEGLKRIVQDTVALLNSFGIGRNDRVAIVLPNGAEMAAAFIAVSAGATAAPLNPSYCSEEFEFYMKDLNVKALVIERDSTSCAKEVARRLGLNILELIRGRDKCAGEFKLTGSRTEAVLRGGYAQSEDTALILHTSGTTSRPKIVPLTHRNIAFSVRNVAETLNLSSADCGLNIMPLFHIHGLVAGLLAPLSSGGSVFCAPGFNALKFFSWMNEAKPTWYTAVPTMHQAILARAGGNADVIKRNPLRFIRSSSASLSPQVLVEIENVFRAPVIEAYGMTEAAHQMTSNLLLGSREPGFVGFAAGPEVLVIDEMGNPKQEGEIGEVAIRGDNVMAGYESNPTANAEAFINGWFRTGDQGVMDGYGRLRLTGRLKEIINRGGEKISPREVDDVISEHPAILQVVTFSFPHEKLGEDLAAAIVLKSGFLMSERELRDFLSLKLAPYKIPDKILFLDDIPKGPTGKLQRIGLAQKLGLAQHSGG